jgi:hypothetical protein
MATVNKNFRIKNGLIVEGTSGTIDGYNILTENQASQDFIVNTIGGTSTRDNTPNTVVKRDGFGNFAAGQIDLSTKLTTPLIQIQNAGSIYEDSGFNFDSNSGYDINLNSAQNINLTANSGQINLNTQNAYVNEDEIVTRTASQTLSNKELVNPLINGQVRLEDSNGNFQALISLSSDELMLDTDSRNIILSPEGGNVYIQNSSAPQNIVSTQGDLENHSNSTSGVHGVNGDVVGTSDQQSLSNKTFTGPTYFQSGGGAGGNNNHIDVDNNTGKLVIESGYALDLSSSNDVTITSGNSDIVLNPDGTAYIGSKTSDNQIATHGYADNAASNALSSANTYTDTAVANLVDSAPEALNTLNELARALGDNVDGMTGLATSIGNKLPLAGGTMSGAIAMGSNKITGLGTPTANSDAATKQYADNAQSTAESNAADYTDQEINKTLDGTYHFSTVNVGDVSTQTAAQVGGVNTSSIILGFDSAVYRAGKAVIKISNGTHTQVSELLITLDSSNNVAVTEYGIVTTNGNLADVWAEYKGGTGYTNIWVNPVNGYTVTATVILTAIK